MATYTLSALRTRVQEAADIEAYTDRHTPAKIDAHIQFAWQRLYAMLMEHGIILPTEQVHFITADGSGAYSLPTDWGATIGVFREIGGSWVPLARMDRRDLPFDADQGRNAAGATHYRVAAFMKPSDRRVELRPRPPSGEYRHMYVPHPELLDDVDNFVDVPFGWEEYVVLLSAIRLLRQDNVDTSELRFDFRVIMDEIKANAADQELNNTYRIQPSLEFREDVFLDSEDIDLLRWGW